jgi:hypothetical protein
MEYCPDCIIPLFKDYKKLGNCSAWLKCPKCGLRKRPEQWFDKVKDQENFTNFKSDIHSHNRFKG